jgi:hypothetical protein
MSNGFVFRPISQRIGALLVFVVVLLLPVMVSGQSSEQSSSGQSGSGQSSSGQSGSGQSGSGQSGSGQSDQDSKSSGQADKDSKSSSQGDKSGQSDKDTTPKAQSGSNADAQADAKTDRDTKSDASDGYSKLRVQITGGDTNKPIGNASVYVRYDEAPSGLLHKTHQAELNFKSNQDGTVKVPSVPRGKVLIQVIAPGWHTYGEWYDVTKDEQVIDIHLAKPPRWY